MKTNKASTWQSRFDNRKRKMQKIFEDAQKYYDIMYAVQNTGKISPWKSKVYLPILASKAWDLIARMSDVVPLFNVTIKNELEMSNDSGTFGLPQDVIDRQQRIEAKLHYDYKTCGSEPMKLKVFDPLLDAVVAGTGYAQAPWMFEVKKTHGRMVNEDGTMDNTRTVVKKSAEGYNGFKGLNFFNVFPADADSFYEAPYLIVRYYRPLVDLKKEGIYQNLDKVNKESRQDTDFELFNVSRNRVVNEEVITNADDTVDMVTYYECYERTEKGVELTVYAEGRNDKGATSPWVEIRPTRVPYWHDMFPIVPFYCRKKSYSVFGESLFENNRTLQSATNDLFNHYLDNWNLSIESMIMYEDGTLTNDFIIEPGGEITYTGEKPSQFKFPEPNPQQLSVVMGVIEKGVENATFSQYASGVPNSANDKTQGTAYGVKTITEAATTKIGFFRDNFKQSMKVVGQLWLSHLQQFADAPEEIRRQVNGQEVPDIVMPSDYQGEMELDIDDDSMIPMSKQEKRDMHQAFINEIKALQDMAMIQTNVFKQPSDIPRINFMEVLEDTAELYSKKDFNRYLLDNKVQIPQDQGPQVKDFVNFAYKDFPPDVQAQAEQMLGFQPSAMHDSTLTHQAIQMGAQQGQLTNPQIGMTNGTGQKGNSTNGATA
ncbi:MAG: hypothetical protein KDH96_02070 [Candidatus Riesia sp.]|nr:hypothetical protein [Candidatus Riesia sp.]